MSVRSEVIRIYNELIAGAKKISALPAAGALTGSELVEGVQGGANVKMTTQGIADLGGVGVYQLIVNSATALVDAASMDLTSIKHTLASSSATRTFTISYTGDDVTLEVTLSATSATYTFPASSLCVSEGVASGDNTLSLSGVSGDKYIIAIKKIGSAYYVVSKNFGQ